MQRYRTLEAWKQARALALAVLEATETERTPKSWAVFDQLKRAAVSVEANVVEGYAYGTTPAFLRHLRIALGSAAEAEILLELALARGYMAEAATRNLLAQVNRCLGCLFGLMKALRRRRS